MEQFEVSLQTKFSAGGTLPCTYFGGVRFTPLSVDETVGVLADRDPNLAFAVFVTPNVEHCYFIRKEPEHAQCVRDSLVSTNDSRVLGRMAKFAGLDLKFAPGAYVVKALFEDVIAHDDPISIIGSSDDIVQALIAKYGLSRVAHHIPPMGFIRNPEAVDDAIEFVNSHPSRFVFVAMGPPQSELYCQRIIGRAGATGIGLCIGSSLAVLVGDSDPAPDFMEQTGLVWLYRLIREPKRLWQRYLVRDTIGLWYLFADLVRLRLGQDSKPYV